MKEQKTMHQAFEDLEQAWNDYVLELAYSLKIDKVVNWLSDKIKELNL